MYNGQCIVTLLLVSKIQTVCISATSPISACAGIPFKSFLCTQLPFFVGAFGSSLGLGLGGGTVPDSDGGSSLMTKSLSLGLVCSGDGSGRFSSGAGRGLGCTTIDIGAACFSSSF